MLPHAENLTADHHSHVTVPLKTFKKIISHLDIVVIATVFPWCNLLIAHNVKVLNNSVYSKSLNLLLIIVHHYTFYIVKSFSLIPRRILIIQRKRTGRALTSPGLFSSWRAGTFPVGGRAG